MIGRVAVVLVALLAGYGLRWVTERAPAKMVQEEAGDGRRAVVALEEAKARLALQVESQAQRIRELEADRAALRKELASRQERVEGKDSGRFDLHGLASTVVKTQMEQRKKRVLDEIGFTAEQRAKLEARLRTEGGGGEGMEGWMQELMTFEEVLRELGTSEQMEAYQRFQEEEKRANAEMVAHAEFAQLRTAIKLEPEQEDEVFQALAEISLEQMEAKALPDSNVGPGKVLEQMMARKKEVMAKVLTPEQWKAYEALLDQQQEMARRMLESMGPMGSQ